MIKVVQLVEMLKRTSLHSQPSIFSTIIVYKYKHGIKKKKQIKQTGKWVITGADEIKPKRLFLANPTLLHGRTNRAIQLKES